jgi:two-component system, OmpR family, sensor histidine kinase VanS
MSRPHSLRLPSSTVRLRLTLLYSSLFLAFGAALLVTSYLLFRNDTGVDLIVPHQTVDGAHPIASYSQVARQVQRAYEASVARHSHGLHEGLLQSAVALAILTVVSIALGWLVAGRVLLPLRTMTATTRQISEHNLNARLALIGPQDELKDLADTVDGLLARLEAHVAEQQRFAANASHELRTPLSITQTLLEVAANDPDHDHEELIARLRVVNDRAVGLTEALLLLSRAGHGSFPQERVDLSLVVEQAAETLLPLAERRGVTVQVSGETAATAGSPALLLQLATNLLQNAIIHNLPDQGTVWASTSAEPAGVVLAVENTGETLTPQLVATLDEPFQRGVERQRPDHAGVGLGLAIVKSIVAGHGGSLAITPRDGGGLRVVVQLPESLR